jgi:predicted nucleic acid-binding protein
MSYCFLDTSALVKRYMQEKGSDWVIHLTDPSNENSIILADITIVEATAAIAARHRASRGISLAERDAIVALLIYHRLNEYQLVPFNHEILDLAVQLTQNHRLRGCDAVQLATALHTHRTLVAIGLDGLSFIAADNDLVAAAKAENMQAINPNEQDVAMH